MFWQKKTQPWSTTTVSKQHKKHTVGIMGAEIYGVRADYIDLMQSGLLTDDRLSMQLSISITWKTEK